MSCEPARKGGSPAGVAHKARSARKMGPAVTAQRFANLELK